jgi:SAM-dependent methyltransferase
MVATADNSVRETARTLAQCIACATHLGDGERCPSCDRSYGNRDGILEAIDPLTGRNRIAAAFYDGAGWEKFRPWERLFLRFQGGAHARRVILRHLPSLAHARVLEVGIGDGENLAHLRGAWDVYGVDIARTQLVKCLERHPKLSGRLAWAEAEALPFADESFDATYTVGGFNFFGDHAAAVSEMMRVTRRGGTIVIADELPTLHRLGFGSLLGFPEIDRFGLRQMGLDAKFVEMALDCRLDLHTLASRMLPQARRYAIWNRLGYCLVSPRQ